MCDIILVNDLFLEIFGQTLSSAGGSLIQDSEETLA